MATYTATRSKVSCMWQLLQIDIIGDRICKNQTYWEYIGSLKTNISIKFGVNLIKI